MPTPSFRAATALLFATISLAALTAAAPSRPASAAALEPEGPPAASMPATEFAASPLRARATPLRVTSTGSDGTWQLVAPPAGIPRFEPSVVYDPSRSRMVVFGGGSDDSVASDTWIFTFSNGQWSRLTTAGTPPSPRRLQCAVYDPSGDRMVIYGGFGNGLLDDAWQLTFTGTPTWTPITTTGTPGPRANAACAYDPTNDQLVMFGGYDGVSEPLGRSSDVWTLSLGATPTWTQLAPTGDGPGGRMGVTAGWDATHHAMYVFGGSDSMPHNDLWSLSIAGAPVWNLVSDGTNGPAPRKQAVGGYDPISGKFAVFGGYDNVSLFADLWTIPIASPTWSDVTPDPTIRARWGAGGLVTPSGTLVVTGGVNASRRLEADTWTISVGSPTGWTPVSDLYPYRMQEMMVMDPSRHRFIAFGGTDGSYRNDTYVHPLDTGRGWSLLPTAGTLPAARRLHAGIYDPVGDRLIMFGGYNGAALGDLWQLTLSGTPTWSPLVANGSPPSPRAGHIAVYDPVGQRMIIGMGWDGVTPPGNTTGTVYALSLNGTPTWSQLPSGPAVSSTVGVYDAAQQSILVFGGGNGVSLTGNTWQLSLGASPAWTKIATNGPDAREEMSSVYDVKRDRMVTFGGYDVPYPNYRLKNDTWAFGPTAGAASWDSLAPGGTGPSPRWGMKALYDPELDGMWLYGGWAGTYSQQLYFLQWSDPSSPEVANLQSSEAVQNGFNLSWTLPEPVRSTITVERSVDGTNWSTVADQLSSGTSFAFADRTAQPGGTYAWRLVVRNGGTLMASAPVWLTSPTGVAPKPAAAFGLRRVDTISHGSIGVLCSLPQRAPGRVELLDVSGRLRDARDVSSLSAGQSRVDLGQDLEAGVYFVRLTSGAHTAALKGIVLH
jgi:hypothetical protein